MPLDLSYCHIKREEINSCPIFPRQVLNKHSESIAKAMLKQYMSPTGPKKYLRDITPTETDQLELDLF